jgi:hypothetical protein
MREVLPAPDFIGTWCLSSISHRDLPTIVAGARCGSQSLAGVCPGVSGGARAATIFVVMPEMAVIRRLATWGFSLILQQAPPPVHSSPWWC